MNKNLNHRYRYDHFIIWGNGLEYTEEILDIIREQDDLEIIRIERRTVQNMEKFVFDLYACDTVPINHLRAKLRYLFDVSPEVIIVFVKNHAPEEQPTGQGAFRKVQCQYINQIKRGIREKFNPRKNGKRTEEHAIHASDFEEQVDYLLKLLGHPEGIRYLEDSGAGLPFRIPYQIPHPTTYTFRRLPITELRASILQQHANGDVNKSLLPVAETPHYLSLIGSPNFYIDYLKQFRYTYLTENHTLERLLQLSRLTNEQVYNFDPILVKASDNGFRILDGVHRAAVTLYHGFEKIRCVELIY